MEIGKSYLQLLSGYHKMGCICLYVFKVLLEQDYIEIKARSLAPLFSRAKLKHLKI